MPKCVNAFIHVIFQWLLGIVCISSSASLETYSKLLLYFLVLFDISACLFQLQSFPCWESGKWVCWVNYTNFQNSTSLLFEGAEAKESLFIVLKSGEQERGLLSSTLKVEAEWIWTWPRLPVCIDSAVCTCLKSVQRCWSLNSEF